MTTKSETQDVVITLLFRKFLFYLFSFACGRIEFLLQFFLLIAILIFFISHDRKKSLKTSTMEQWTPTIKINKSNESKVKNPAN